MINEFNLGVVYQELAQARRPLCKYELAKRLELSPKTIERKLVALQDLGAELDITIVPAGGHSFKHVYRLRGKCPCCGKPKENL